MVSLTAPVSLTPALPVSLTLVADPGVAEVSGIGTDVAGGNAEEAGVVSGAAEVGVGGAGVGIGAAEVGVGGAGVGIGAAEVGVGGAGVGIGAAEVGVGVGGGPSAVTTTVSGGGTGTIVGVGGATVSEAGSGAAEVSGIAEPRTPMVPEGHGLTTQTSVKSRVTRKKPSAQMHLPATHTLFSPRTKVQLMSRQVSLQKGLVMFTAISNPAGQVQLPLTKTLPGKNVSHSL
jgi:hypothetical protein